MSTILRQSCARRVEPMETSWRACRYSINSITTSTVSCTLLYYYNMILLLLLCSMYCKFFLSALSFYLRVVYRTKLPLLRRQTPGQNAGTSCGKCCALRSGLWARTHRTDRNVWAMARIVSGSECREYAAKLKKKKKKKRWWWVRFLNRNVPLYWTLFCQGGKPSKINSNFTFMMEKEKPQHSVSAACHCTVPQANNPSPRHCRACVRQHLQRLLFTF